MISGSILVFTVPSPRESYHCIVGWGLLVVANCGKLVVARHSAGGVSHRFTFDLDSDSPEGGTFLPVA